MSSRSQALTDAMDGPCGIARSLRVLTDPWSVLLLREAVLGRRTYAQFRDALGIATDVLSARLANLVEHGVLERSPYREAGQRTRDQYTLTTAGHELKVVLVAMQQWGEEHMPVTQPPALIARDPRSGTTVRVAAVNALGQDVVPTEIELVVPAQGDAQPGPAT